MPPQRLRFPGPLGIVLLAWLFPGTTLLGQVPDTTSYLVDLALEQLMDVRISSVSKRAENLFGASAAVQVIQATDIRRSGATSIPELLRLVPGLQVNRFTASEFAVTARGFGDVFGNKMLILIDGRSLYSPLFSGVRWQEHQVVLEGPHQEFPTDSGYNIGSCIDRSWHAKLTWTF